MFSAPVSSCQAAGSFLADPGLLPVAIYCSKIVLSGMPILRYVAYFVATCSSFLSGSTVVDRNQLASLSDLDISLASVLLCLYIDARDIPPMYEHIPKLPPGM